MPSTLIHAPHPLPKADPRPHVFLAGSIEMGKAVDWQAEVAAALADLECVILNPRRPDWDSSWVQEASNPQFRQQVEWELDALDSANVIALYLAPGTQSPISLLELGLHADYSGLIVCCPAGFWRKGNVDLVCERKGVATTDSLAHLISVVRGRIMALQLVPDPS